MKNKNAQLKGRYSSMTVQQLEILAKLIKNDWINYTSDLDHMKGKISYKKGRYKVKFDYINTWVIKGRTTLTREVTISDELLDLIFNV